MNRRPTLPSESPYGGDRNLSTNSPWRGAERGTLTALSTAVALVRGSGMVRVSRNEDMAQPYARFR